MSGFIRRDPDGAASEVFDLIVIGGGMQGIMLALEATRRRLRPLVLERADFAGATTDVGLRLLDRGLRELAAFEIGRATRASGEHAWWGRNFPELVQPLPCVMPVHGPGGRHARALRRALALDRMLGRLRPREQDDPAQPAIVPSEQVIEAWPTAARDGLTGGLAWTGSWAPAGPRLGIEALRWACQQGAVALNYVEVGALVMDDGKVRGVDAVDHVGGERRRFRAPLVIAAAGPWTADLLGRSTVCMPPHFTAWNVLLERAPASRTALALDVPEMPEAPLFLLPLGERILAGTAATREQAGGRPGPDAARAFLGLINRAVPGLALGEADVVRMFAGRLPGAGSGLLTPLRRPAIVDAGRNGGPRGLFAVVGTGVTMTRAVADRTLRLAAGAARALPLGDFARPRRAFGVDDLAIRRWLRGQGLDLLRRIAVEESVVHLDDLILRRTPLGDRPVDAMTVGAEACRLLGHGDSRRRSELERLRRALAPPARRPPAWLRDAARPATPGVSSLACAAIMRLP